jgi:hypothetical protein
MPRSTLVVRRQWPTSQQYFVEMHTATWATSTRQYHSGEIMLNLTAQVWPRTWDEDVLLATLYWAGVVEWNRWRWGTRSPPALAASTGTRPTPASHQGLLAVAVAAASRVGAGHDPPSAYRSCWPRRSLPHPARAGPGKSRPCPAPPVQDPAAPRPDLTSPAQAHAPCYG